LKPVKNGFGGLEWGKKGGTTEVLMNQLKIVLTKDKSSEKGKMK